MELIRGWKPLTEIEQAVAAELYRTLKPEIDTMRELHPDLLAYERGFHPNKKREMSQKEIEDKRAAKLRYCRECHQRQKAMLKARKG